MLRVSTVHKHNHDLYPNPYQQHCPIFSEHSKLPAVLAGTHTNQLEAVTAHHHVVCAQPDDAEALSKPQTPAIEKKKIVMNKSCVDTSTFSIEERLVAAVWVHERKHTNNNISQIKLDFRQRFGRDSPAKNTLLVWERKLFSTGSVHDAPRPGRPVNRRTRMDEVVASVRSAPTLSLRARARALRVPRTTLRTILHHDLPLTPSRTKEPAHHAPTGKNIIKRNVKKQLGKPESQGDLGVGAYAAPRTEYT